MFPRLTLSSSQLYDWRSDVAAIVSTMQSGLPVMIAVMGATGSGKTSLVNLASHSSLRVGIKLESCTAEVQRADLFTLDGRGVILIDTPGFDDTSRSDTDVLKMIAAFLATTYEKGAKLAGVIYVHRISDNRFAGIAQRNFKMFRELCGDTSLENVVLVTSMWDDVPLDVGESREEELSSNFFKPALNKGARMVRHQNTEQSAHDIIRMIMKNRPVVLQIQRELVDEHKNIVNTAAGETINKELDEQIRWRQAQLEEVQEQMVQALNEGDEETREEMEEETRNLQELLEKIKKDSESMASNYAKEKKKMEARTGKIQKEMEKERKRVEAEFNLQIADLNRRLQEEIQSSEEERAKLKQDIQNLQSRINDFVKPGCCVVM